VDVIFLDVEMPGMSGLQLLENISESNIQIILITSHEKYALQAFDFNVTDYIVKPIVEERFLKAVLKAKQKHTASKSATAEQDLFVKVNAGLVKINTMNILYLESMTNHVAIYTTNGRFVVHGTLKSMENKLSEDLFM